jgi:hypothetical protein
MLLHAMISWPDLVKENLWPYALCLTVNLHNSTPGISGLSSEEIFRDFKRPHKLSDFRPFYCLVFVPDLTLQQRT